MFLLIKIHVLLIIIILHTIRVQLEVDVFLVNQIPTIDTTSLQHHAWVLFDEILRIERLQTVQVAHLVCGCGWVS